MKATNVMWLVGVLALGGFAAAGFASDEAAEHAAEAAQGAQLARAPEGAKVYEHYCQACHQANG